MDDIIQKILLEGDGEVLRALNEVGHKGAEVFKELEEATRGGAGGLESFGNALGGIVGAITTAVAGVAAFVEAQDELTQKTAFVASSMGTTVGVINSLEEAFASAGVASSTFERFANRLATSIAQDWPAITEAVRTSATKQREAQEGIISATLRVKEAQDKVKFGAAEDSQKMANAQLAVRSAVLGVEAAEIKLQTALGNPPDAAQQKMLEISQAELGVRQARQALVDAELAQAKAAAEVQNTQLQIKNALAEAEDRLASAREKADHQALSDIPKIATALKGLVDGNEKVAKSVDLTQVSAHNLRESMILLAAKMQTGIKPTGIEVFNELTKVLHANINGLITADQELSIVSQLSGRSMGMQGIAAAEVLAQVKLGPDHFAKWDAANKSHVSTSEASVETAKQFKSALGLLHQQVELTSRDLAIMASPALISFFQTLQSSITETGGLLNTFVNGIEGIGQAIGTAVTKFNEFAAAADKAFSFEGGTTAKTILLAILGVIALIATAWIAWPLLIAGVVVAVGELAAHWDIVKSKVQSVWDVMKDVGPIAQIRTYITDMGTLASHWDDIKTKIGEAWTALKDSSVAQFISMLVSNMSDLVKYVAKLLGFTKTPEQNAAAGQAAMAKSDQQNKTSADMSATQQISNDLRQSPEEAAAKSLAIMKRSDDINKATGQYAPPPMKDFYHPGDENKAAAAADGLGEVAKAAHSAAAGLGSLEEQAKAGAKARSGGDYNSSSQAGGGYNAHAEGGMIDGPGTTTSDSIFARLSRGEFVMKARAVQQFGANFMHMINNGIFPGFAMGGLVPSPVRLAGGGGSGQALSTVNLSIDGHTFNGFRGSKSVVDDLTSFAISRQTSAAGKNPNWMK